MLQVIGWGAVVIMTLLTFLLVLTARPDAMLSLLVRFMEKPQHEKGVFIEIERVRPLQEA